MPDTKQTVLVRPMPGYSSTHVIFATKFGSIDRDFRLDGKEVHLPAGVAHFLEHKMFELPACHFLFFHKGPAR